MSQKCPKSQKLQKSPVQRMSMRQLIQSLQRLFKSSKSVKNDNNPKNPKNDKNHKSIKNPQSTKISNSCKNIFALTLCHDVTDYCHHHGEGDPVAHANIANQPNPLFILFPTILRFGLKLR